MMADLIDRQAAINAVLGACKDTATTECAIRELEELPPAQPTQTNALKALDCVERQAAIDAINSHFGFNTEEEYGSAVQEVINGLPSAQTETSILTVTVAPDSEEIERVVRKIKDAPVMAVLSAQPTLRQTCDKLAIDCISRQAAIDALEREKIYSTAYKDGYTQTDYFKQYNMGLTDGIKALNKLPSTQPERKKGQWIFNGFTKCSECGYQPKFSSGWNFCPNCGSDNRGK